MIAIQNGGFDWLWWLCLAVVIGLVIAGIWAVYTLGGLPGRIAAARGHPQASAIGVCGWLGLITFVLWPIALVWAYTSPKGGQNLATSEDLDALVGGPASHIRARSRHRGRPRHDLTEKDRLT